MEEEGREEGVEEEGKVVVFCSSLSTAAATAAVSSHSSLTSPLKEEERREGGREGISSSISPFRQFSKAVRGLMTTFTPNFNHSLFLISLGCSKTGERPARVRWERREGGREGGREGVGDGAEEEEGRRGSPRKVWPKPVCST
jgi:hypothetical protein